MANSPNERSSRKFTLALQASARQVPEMHVKLQQAVAIEGLKRLVFKTPVDTGRARGSWQASRILNEKETERLDPGGTSTISRGTRNISRIHVPFRPYFLFSNLPYIVRLEDGSSQQAPQGMVALTRMELRAFARRTSSRMRFRIRRR